MKILKTNPRIILLILAALFSSCLFSQTIGVSSGSISSINCGSTLPSFTCSTTPTAELASIDPTGCCPSFIWSVSSVSGPASVTVNSSGLISVSGCNTTATTGQVNLTFEWTNSSGSIQTTQISNNTFTILATNPVIYASVNNSNICTGQSSTLTATGTGASSYTYHWVNGSTSQSITTGTAGTYSVTVTGSNGIGAIASGTVNVYSTPTISVNNSTICSGVSTTLTATSTNATNWTWSPGSQVGQSITVSPTSTTTYTVTASNPGCSSTATGTITVNPSPNTTVNSPTICAGQTTTLTATGGTSYHWNTGPTSASISVTPANTTTYTVTATGANGCTANANSIVTVNPLPTPIVGYGSLCTGGIAVLSAFVNPSIPVSNYSWSNGTSGYGANIDIVTATGTYNVTVTSSANCSATGSGTITANSHTAPSVTLSPTGNCLNVICPQYGSVVGPTLTATPSGGTSPYSYTWTGGATGSTGSTSPSSASWAIATTFTVIVSDANSCAASASMCTIGSSHRELPADGPPALQNVFNIYPNPASHSITVDYTTLESTVYTIRIIDLLGKEVQMPVSISKDSGNDKQEINISSLPSGIYICELSGDQTYRVRFIKQ